MLRSIDVAAHAGTAFDGKWNAAASRNDSVERHQIVEIVELEGSVMRKMKAASLADLVTMAAKLHLAPRPH